MRKKKINYIIMFLFIHFNLIYSQENDYSIRMENQIKEVIKTEYIFNHIYKSKYDTKFKVCESNDYLKYIKDLNLEYQDTGISLFEEKIFFIKISRYIKDGNGQIKLPSTFINDLGLEKGLLISYSSGCINILSGDIYNSLFSHRFKLSFKDPTSFYEYLKIKLYIYNIKEFEYEKQNAEWIYFSGIETIFTKPTKVFFKVKKNFPDLVIQLGHKLSGKYKEKEKIIIN